MYITAFASISSNRNRGSFDSEELGPSKCKVVLIDVEEKIQFRVEATFSRAKSLKASEGYTNSHD